MPSYISIDLEKSRALVTTSNKSALVTNAIIGAAGGVAALPGVGVPLAIGTIVLGGLAAGISSIFAKEQKVEVGALLRAASAQALQSSQIGYGFYSQAPGVPFSAKLLGTDVAMQLVTMPAQAVMSAILESAPPDFTGSLKSIATALGSLQIVIGAPGVGSTYPIIGYSGSIGEFPAPPPPIGGGTLPPGGGGSPVGTGAGGGITSLVTVLSLITLLNQK